MKASMRIVLCALVLLLATAVDSRAQGRATVNGVVVGPGGMPQANVTVIITNAQAVDRRAVSDMAGAFVFGGLQPGTYRLRTDDDTFAPFGSRCSPGFRLPRRPRSALPYRAPSSAPTGDREGTSPSS